MTNAGTIAISSGESLSVVGSYSYLSFDNAAGGARATIGGVGWANQGTIVVGSGSSLTLEGNFDTASLSGITYTGGTLALQGTPEAGGLITAQGGLLAIDPTYLDYDNPNIDVYPYINVQTFQEATLAIDSGATLELQGTPQVVYTNLDGTPIFGGDITTGQITFNGADATLKLDDPNDFSGTFNDLTIGDTIDFADETVTSAVFGASSLSIATTSGSLVNYGVFPGDPSGTLPVFWPDEVSLTSDGATGTCSRCTPIPPRPR